MQTNDISESLTTLFSELTDGANTAGGAYVLNSGDAGLLRSLDKLSAADASRSVHGGATIAAHAQHVRYGLSLMNGWAREGGDPFADATWDEAWRIGAVDDGQWADIRDGLRGEARRWLEILGSPRSVARVELNGMIGSIVHLAYHLGAMRQIAAGARGPREGTFKTDTEAIGCRAQNPQPPGEAAPTGLLIGAKGAGRPTRLRQLSRNSLPRPTAKRLFALMTVVRTAPEREVLDARRPSTRERDDVMELQLSGVITSPSRPDEGASSFISRPHFASHRGRNMPRA